MDVCIYLYVALGWTYVSTCTWRWNGRTYSLVRGVGSADLDVFLGDDMYFVDGTWIHCGIYNVKKRDGRATLYVRFSIARTSK